VHITSSCKRRASRSLGSGAQFVESDESKLLSEIDDHFTHPARLHPANNDGKHKTRMGGHGSNGGHWTG